jgi:spore coat polysaccharide biosynthesis protein SpsF
VKTVIIVQARMTSTRLPGKVLMKVLGKPLLEYLIERLRKVSLADEIVIATTINATDEPIIELCNRLGVNVCRGPEDDVLARYYQTARLYNADTVVRVTSDCPLLDPLEVDRVVGFYLSHRQEFDYVSNGLVEPYPKGMDCEVFSMAALQQAFDEAASPAEREHVTLFFYQNISRFRLTNVPFSASLPPLRLTVDTREDFELVRDIIEFLYPVNADFHLDDIVNALTVFPDWRQINAHILQKSTL